MIIISARLLASDSRGQKPETLREEHLQYSEIIKEVRLALAEGYEPTFFGDDEFNHIITFLKYGPGDQAIMIITVRGTREEIESLQIDPKIKKYF